MGLFEDWSPEKVVSNAVTSVQDVITNTPALPLPPSPAEIAAAAEAERKRLEDIALAEKQRLDGIAAAAAAAAEEERKRQEDIAAAEAEKQRLAAEAEQQRVADIAAAEKQKADDAATEYHNSMIDVLDKSVQSVKDLHALQKETSENLSGSISDFSHNTQNSIGDVWHNAADSVTDSVDQMGALDVGKSIEKLGDTVGHWWESGSDGVAHAGYAVGQGWHNWQDDPRKEWVGVTGGVKSTIAAVVRPFGDLYNDIIGAHGDDSLKGMGFGEEDRGGSQAAGKAVSSAAVVAASIILAIPSGGSSLSMGAVAGAGLVTADVVSANTGGSGDFIKDNGGNDEWSAAGHIVAAASAGAGVEELGKEAGQNAVETSAKKAAMSAAVTSHGDAKAMAIAAMAAGLATGVTGDMPDTKTGSIEKAAATGAVSGGISAAAQGKSTDDILRSAAFGGAAAGSAQAINTSLDVGKGQTPVLDADGSQMYDENGVAMMHQTNSLQHVTNDVNGTDQIYGESASIDHGWNWQLPTAMVTGGAVSGGLIAEGDRTSMADGALQGAVAGAVGYAGQKVGEIIAGLVGGSASTIDTSGAAGNIVGSVAGSVMAQQAIIDNNHVKEGAIPLPDYVANRPSSSSKVDANFTTHFTGSKNLGMLHRKS